MSLRAFLCLIPLALLGCGNPSLDVEIEALKGEVPGVPETAFHRPGQPCVHCHGPYKGAKPEMALAGTIFAIPTNGTRAPVPVANAKITITDALGLVNGVQSPPATPPPKVTNCAGNFFFTTEEIKAAFPYEVRIECPEPSDVTKIRAERTMRTRIAREGSCNECHQGVKNQSSPGWVVCEEDVANTGITVYPAITRDNCPQAVPASGGSTGSSSSGSSSSGTGP
jgi:hypothetical protein